MPARLLPAETAALGADDRRALSAIIRAGSKSFHAASLLLPPQTRHAAASLYAFCRISDDIADDPRASHVAIAGLRERLDRIYAGRPRDHVADRAFAAVASRHQIPRMVPEALLEGFEWDIDGRAYATIADLHAYAARVAGTVGVMMAMVMGRRSAGVLSRACELGLAMQLTNIARDVGEDARNGRLYLPRDWMAEEGLDPDDFLARPEFSPALGRVVARLLAEAGRLYASSADGVPALPAACRPAIRSAAAIYAEIGRKVAAGGFDSVSSRAVTTRRRKVALLARAIMVPGARGLPRATKAGGQTGGRNGDLPEAARFLVQACAGHDLKPAPLAARLDERLVRLIALFETMERRNRAASHSRRSLE